MREQAVEAVVFGAGGVRYRGLADSEGLGIGGEAVSIDDMLNLARIYAASAVDVCSQARDGLGLTSSEGASTAPTGASSHPSEASPMKGCAGGAGARTAAVPTRSGKSAGGARA